MELLINDIKDGYITHGDGIGKRVMSISLAGCNIDKLCGNFCSNCSARWAQEATNSRKIDINRIYNQIMKNKSKTVIFSGGEPTLYTEELSHLIALLNDEKDIIVETHGGNEFNFTYSSYIFNRDHTLTFSIHPKFPPFVEKVTELNIFYSINKIPCNYFVIFTVSELVNWQTMKEQLKVLRRVWQIPDDKIWLTPNGNSYAENIKDLSLCSELGRYGEYNISRGF